jgi:hypothetical protein
VLLALLIAATVQGPFDIESLTASADAVVYGRVIRRSTAWAKGGGQIFTTVVVHALETWKGAPQTETTVLVPGGDVGDLSQTVHGAAAFHDGEEVVVFLHRRAPGTYAVEAMALGKFAVATAPNLPKRAVRDRRGVTCLRCAPGEQDDLLLDELSTRVLGSARR